MNISSSARTIHKYYKVVADRFSQELIIVLTRFRPSKFFVQAFPLRDCNQSSRFFQAIARFVAEAIT